MDVVTAHVQQRRGQHGARRDLPRDRLGVVVGQQVGDALRALPLRAGGEKIAGPQPFRGAHVPVVGLHQRARGLEVGGDQRGVLVGARIAGLDGRREPAVRLGAVGAQLRFVGHGAHQRVPEAIPLARNEFDLVDELRGHQLGQPRRHAVRSQRLQRGDVEAGSDHRRGVQDGLRLRVQPVDTGGQHGLDGGGHLDALDGAGEPITAATAREHTATGQIPDDLLDKERITRCGNGYPVGQTRRRRVGPQQLVGQSHRRRRGQRSQRDRVLGAAAQRPVELRAARFDQHRRRRQCRPELGQDVLAGRVDPVRILEDEHRSRGAHPGRLRHQLDQTTPPAVDADLLSGGGDPHRVEQDVHVVGRRRVLAEAAGDALGGLIVGESVHPEQRAQHPRQHPERDRRGVRLAPSDDDLGAAVRGERDELVDQSALAQPGCADDPDQPAAGLENRAQPVELGVPAEHRPVVAARHHLTGFHREQLPRRHRGVRALDRDGLDRAEPGGMLDEARGGQRTQHLTRAGARLHPLRDPDGMADGRVPTWAPTDFTGDHVAGVQPDADLQRDSVTSGHLGGEVVGRRLDCQRRDAAAQGVILERHRRAEQGHQAVAGELVDRALVALHHRGRTVEQLVHDGLQALGVQRCRQLHRPHHVDEQHCHLLVLADRRARGHRRTAGVAEPRLRAQVVTARPAPTGGLADRTDHERPPAPSIPP